MLPNRKISLLERFRVLKHSKLIVSRLLFKKMLPSTKLMTIILANRKENNLVEQPLKI